MRAERSPIAQKKQNKEIERVLSSFQRIEPSSTLPIHKRMSDDGNSILPKRVAKIRNGREEKVERRIQTPE